MIGRPVDDPRTGVNPWGQVQAKPATPAKPATILGAITPVLPREGVPAIVEALAKHQTSVDALVRQMNVLRETLMGLAAVSNVSRPVRIDATRSDPIVVKSQQVFNFPAFKDVSAVALAGGGGVLQVRTAEMGDADFLDITQTGPIFENEMMEELVVRMNPVGTGVALLRLGAWIPPRGV